MSQPPPRIDPAVESLIQELLKAQRDVDKENSQLIDRRTWTVDKVEKTIKWIWTMAGALIIATGVIITTKINIEHDIEDLRKADVQHEKRNSEQDAIITANSKLIQTNQEEIIKLLKQNLKP